MDKQRLCIERELMSNSAQIIWDLISTDSGLARWVADNVTQDGEQLTFVWGELWSHHEVRKGTIVEKIKNEYIKISWDDEDGPDNFFELRMDKSHITNDYVLTITDFAWEDEVDSLKAIWNDNLARLRNSSGI
ncbi:MAG: hypothetical protein HXO19_09225 [Prevotella shahii]|uniref:START-like domain-containing protein n=1 Tax=Hoylesella shahii TaxID=228603 RepID=UPI001CB503AA|nr:START-like domain-containing protein [Hoylesella shahii]MBF1576552.1 hypothetical protein [Hoylesella shahii]MBF1591256.1 hypothetical protein [Hoylesella shahii]